MNRKARRAQSKQLPESKSRAPSHVGKARDLAAAGFMYHQAGRLLEAEKSYLDALQIDPDNIDALYLLGIIFFGTGRRDAGIKQMRAVLKRQPQNPNALYSLAVAHHEEGKLDDAITHYTELLRVKPDYAEALNNLGVVLQERGRLDDAVARYTEALRIKPDHAQALNNLGAALKEQGKIDEAIGRFSACLRIKPDYAEALHNLGSALQAQDKLDDAIARYTEALRIRPSYAEALNNLGVALKEQGKIAEAIGRFTACLRLKPDYVPALYNLGLALREQGKVAEAIALYNRALRLQPDYPDALLSLGTALKEQGKLDEAIASYTQALRVKPDYPDALIQAINLRRQICDWREFQSDETRLAGLVNQSIPPFFVVESATTLENQLACARNWIARRTGSIRSLPEHRPPSQPGQRIRIGYLSGDFREHAVAYATVELFECHDRSRFEIFGYSFGPDDGSEIRGRLAAGFDRFIDVGNLRHSEAAVRIHRDEIDILVDLTGFTAGARTEILAYRPAPIQVNYIGYPGTMGAAFIDYILADPVVAPFEHQPFYRERIVHLPDCYLPYDTKRVIADTTPSRQDCGLPEQGFVFCCFNNAFKIRPDIFAIWMRLLKAVPDSVMWLPDANAWVKVNLRREAEDRGIAATRLVFAPRVSLAEHLSRHRQADLFLDTLPYNAHSTASDALWTGLPVVTCMGPAFAGRVAASLLQAAELPELITTTLADYEALALKLSTDRVQLAAVKEKLASNRRRGALFDTALLTRRIEAAYTRMWETRRDGQPPVAFAVEAGDRAAAASQ